MHMQGQDVKPMSYTLENIIFAVDIEREADAEMKAVPGGGGRGQALRRLDAVKQALLLFIYSKLTMNPLHQFAFMTVGKSASWHQRDFTSNIDILANSVKNLTTEGTFQQFDLSALFQLAAAEARSTQSQGRNLRLILIYCRSSVVPEFNERTDYHNSFTLDALYMHDKPNPNNSPQRVYDTLVDALEHVSQDDGYIFESSSGSARTLFKQTCLLLSHPYQRVGQDEFSRIKDLTQARVASETSVPVAQVDGSVRVS